MVVEDSYNIINQSHEVEEEEDKQSALEATNETDGDIPKLFNMREAQQQQQ